MFSSLFKKHRSIAWTQVFGGTYERDAQGTALAYDTEHVGINLGYEWPVRDSRLGFIGGLVNGTTESSELRSFEIESNNYYLGMYGNYIDFGFNMTLSLIAGYSAVYNDRFVVDNLSGYEVARSQLDSYFFTPSFTLAKAIRLMDKLELRPSANVSYNLARLEGYQEIGTTNSNLKVNGRYSRVLWGRLQMAMAYHLKKFSEIELRAGINVRHNHDDSVRGWLLHTGSSFNFSNIADEDMIDGYVGASLRSEHGEHLSLLADVEFGGNSHEEYLSGSLQLQYIF